MPSGGRARSRASDFSEQEQQQILGDFLMCLSPASPLCEDQKGGDAIDDHFEPHCVRVGQSVGCSTPSTCAGVSTTSHVQSIDDLASCGAPFPRRPAWADYDEDESDFHPLLDQGRVHECDCEDFAGDEVSTVAEFVCDGHRVDSSD